jgi:vancomycin resistance protein YoaR
VGYSWPEMKRILFPLLLASCAQPVPHDPPPPKPVTKPQPALAASPRQEQHIFAWYSTQYKTEQIERSWNIERVAHKLNGVVIDSGAKFSFNERVGPRDEKSGFKQAPVIFMGEMTKDFGGGTCQTSSTLYAAALYAGLDIVDRRGHSRPSTYIKRGMDATVSYPDVDLVLRNQYHVPITLYARAQNGVLTEWFTGDVDAPDAKMAWRGGQLLDFERHYRKTNKYRNDYKRRKQTGKPGQNGVLIVQYQLNEKHWSKRISANYKPVDEIWEVGLGWDMERKPWEDLISKDSN